MNVANSAEPATGPILEDDHGWNAPWLAALIGLGPLLAASRSTEAGLALGLASFAVLVAGNVLVAIAGRHVPARLRPAAILLLIAALVTAVDLLFQARWFDLHGQVGLFVPLIVTHHLILGDAAGFAVRRGLWPALRDGLGYGTGCTLLLAGLGALRELLAPELLVAGLVPGTLFLLAGLVAGRVALRRLWLARRRAP